jgi:iron complex outermembrane receptor protein
LTDRCDGGRLTRARTGAAALAGAAALLGPAYAFAADAPVAFNLPAQPLGEALVAFGLQAGVSVGAADLSLCGPTSRAVVGRYRPRAALGRLLAGTRCEFRAVDARAFNVAPRLVADSVRPASPPVRADPDAVTPVMLLDLVVTTTRRPSIVSRTPASVSVASGPALVAGRLDSLQDLAPEFAGVTVTNLGPGRNKVLVRSLSDGAFTGRTQSTVGLYLDDAPITYNAPDPDLRLVDVDRVELMRGPQGTLYGVGSMGGVVRIVTRKPDLFRAEVGAAAGFAATDSGSPSHSLDGMLNAPLIQGRLGLRLVGYADVAGGYVDDATLAVEDANRTRRQGGRLGISALVSPDWEVSLGGAHQSLKSDDSQYIEGGIGPLQRDIRVREPHQNDFTQAYATVDGSTAIGRLRLSASYLVHAFTTRYDASSGLIVFDANSTVRTFDQKDRVRVGVVEAVLSSRPGPRLQWLAGVFASHATENLQFDLRAVDGPGPYDLYREDRVDRLAEGAVYGELSYAVARDWTLTLGARAFRSWLDTKSLRAQGVIPRTFAGDMLTDGWSPKAVLSWQPSPTKLFYIQAAQGYRMGGFNTTGRVTQQFNASATGNQPNRRYRPDKLWSYELGAKAAFADQRIELRASLFHTDWRDVQSDQFLPSGLPYAANVGRAVNTGFEGEAALRMDRALTLRVSFLANAPELRQRDPTYPARPNASLPAVPRHSAALIADWRRELAPGLTGVLYGRVAYVGASVLTFQEQEAAQMGNYITARLAAGLELSRWRVTAFIENPANAEGDTFAFGDPFTQGRVGQSTPLRPRTIGVTLATGL